MTALLFILTFATCLNVMRLFDSLAYERQSFERGLQRSLAGIALGQTPLDRVVTMLSAGSIWLDQS